MVELAEAQGQAQEADPWKICGFFAPENIGKRHVFGVKPWGKNSMIQIMMADFR